jgi:hypothetical protein
MPSGGHNRLSLPAHNRRGTMRPARHAPQAVCEWCGRSYRPASEGCLGYFRVDGERIERVPFEADNPDTRCPDCGVGVGLLHHGSCSEEECARCGALLKTCRCSDPEVWS